MHGPINTRCINILSFNAWISLIHTAGYHTSWQEHGVAFIIYWGILHFVCNMKWQAVWLPEFVFEEASVGILCSSVWQPVLCYNQLRSSPCYVFHSHQASAHVRGNTKRAFIPPHPVARMHQVSGSSSDCLSGHCVLSFPLSSSQWWDYSKFSGCSPVLLR